jgi:hypothetical protein
VLVAQIVEVVFRFFMELSWLLGFDSVGKSVHFWVVVVCSITRLIFGCESLRDV